MKKVTLKHGGPPMLDILDVPRMIASLFSMIFHCIFDIEFLSITGIQIKGSFIVTVWGFMTFKWGVALFYHSKDYKKELGKLRGSVQGLFIRT